MYFFSKLNLKLNIARNYDNRKDCYQSTCWDHHREAKHTMSFLNHNENATKSKDGGGGIPFSNFFYNIMASNTQTS